MYRLLLLICVLIVGCSVAVGQETKARQLTPEGVKFFESKVRPLLLKHCLECHSGQKPKGAFNLESRAGWQRGGERLKIAPSVDSGGLGGTWIVAHGGDSPFAGGVAEPSSS